MPPESTDFQQRVSQFDAELGALQEKHRVVIVPIVKVSPFGIIPQLQYVDKDEVDKANTPSAGPLQG